MAVTCGQPRAQNPVAVLTAGSWTGIRLAAPLIGRIPDALHAKAYLALLGLVLLVMVVV
jgi:hypothetical protein